MSGLVEDATGGSSTLRVCVLAAVAAGVVTMAAGIVGFFHALSDSMLVIGSGQGLITVVLTLKVWQRHVEERAMAQAGLGHEGQCAVTTKGQRRTDVDAGSGLPPDPQPGDYWFWRERWWCMTPSRFIGNLGLHKVVEHEDGTITVSPSISVTATMAGEKRSWHGFLARGVWRQA